MVNVQQFIQLETLFSPYLGLRGFFRKEKINDQSQVQNRIFGQRIPPLSWDSLALGWSRKSIFLFREI
jgi:hypothetical protein